MVPEADRVRMRHMLEAGNSVMRFVAGRSRQDLDADQMLVFAVVRGLEIIGEAANRVSVQSREACPEIPWPHIVGMRHRLVHAYFDVDLDRVWDTAVRSLPPLIAALERAVEGQAGDEKRA